MFLKRNVLTLSALIAAPLLMLSAASARAADSASDGITVSGAYDVVASDVAVSDLNLASAADQRILRHRLSQAARHVCLDVMGNAGVESDSVLTCYQSSLSEAWTAARERIQVALAKSQSVVASRAPQPVEAHMVVARLR